MVVTTAEIETRTGGVVLGAWMPVSDGKSILQGVGADVEWGDTFLKIVGREEDGDGFVGGGSFQVSFP